MANTFKTIHELTELAEAPAASDELEVWDASASTSKKVSVTNVAAAVIATGAVATDAEVTSAVSTHNALTGASVHGLGTMSTQAASAVAITGGSVTGITDITVADGGTGASTVDDARTNLGLVPVSSLIYDDATAGESTIAMDLATCAYSGTTVYGRKQANTAVLQSSTNGSSIVDKYTFTGEVINGIHALPTGTLIVATSDTNTLVTPSTFVHLWRSTDNGTSFTQVDGGVITAGGYILPWGIASNATYAVAALYGYKAGSTAHYAYRSLDDGLTWTQCLDAGANSNRHLHAAFIDSAGKAWITTGDDSTAGSGSVGGRNVWTSTDNGATWTNTVFYDTDGTTRLQFVGVTEHSGWIYLGEDNSITGGRIYRCKSANPTGTLTVVYDSNVGRRATITPYAHPIYNLWTDTLHNIIYAYAPGESATNRGAFLASADGLNWVVLFETGSGSVNPSAAHFSTTSTSSFIFYANYRIKRKLAAGTHRNKSTQSEVFVFSWPGTLSTQTEKFSLDAGMLGFSFRVVRVTAFARVAGAGGPITVAVKNGATTISATEAIIADGATGNSRYAEATLTKTSMVQRFSAELNSKLVVDVTAGSGGTDLSVAITVERQLTPLWTK